MPWAKPIAIPIQGYTKKIAVIAEKYGKDSKEYKLAVEERTNAIKKSFK